MSLRNAAVALAGVSVGVAPAAAGAPPPDVVAIYQRAAEVTGCGVRPADLAAVQSVESPSAVLQPNGLVTNPDGSPVVGDGGDSHGPFQFNVPAGTWPAYGAGGDPNRLEDAATATARMLCAHGYATDRRSAIRMHNGSGPAAEAYAEKVIERADRLSIDGPAPPVEQVDGLTLRVTDRLLGRALEGWKGFGRWVTGRHPDALPLYARVDAEVHELTATDTAPADLQQISARSVDGVVCPVPGGTVLDGWGSPRSGGRSHQGVDIAGELGEPVVAPFDSRVVGTTDTEVDGGLGGISVWLEATGGPHRGTWVYIAHNRRNTVRQGQEVRQGDQVAELGDTGNARGGTPHVHAQVHPNGGGPVPATSLEHACNQEVQ